MTEFSWPEFEKKTLGIVKLYDPNPNTTGYSIIAHGLTEGQSKELYRKLETIIEKENCQKYVKLEDPSDDHMRSSIGKKLKTIEVIKIKK